jgi:heat shock protein HslJ
MRRIWMLATVGFSIVVVACSAGTPAPSGAGPVDVTGDWQLASGTVDGDPFPIVLDAPITLTVDGTQIGGRSACNHYGGEIVVEGGRPKFSLMSMTEMACAEPVMAAEAAFVAVLPRVVGAARDGDRLTLTGPGVELVFDRLAPVPLADLVGTDWVLDSMVTGDVVSSVAGAPATLRLDAAGTFTGSTGCRTFSGRWVEANGGITPTDLGMDQTDCPPALAGQDGNVVGVLEGFRVSIDGQTLTLTGERGNGLIYRAAS